ncbi:MAG: ATP-dependent helicase RecG [Actinomycetia bacterium]|nr:ATP-dependent helicase RecG [Actinomycetes bacterium]
MGVRDRLRNLTAGTQEIEQGRLSGRYAGLGATSIADAPLRIKTKVAGEITSIRVVPRAGSPSLEVTVNDGTALAVAIFTGRRNIPGVNPGKGIVLDGVARQERKRILLLNPAYQLLS